MKKALFVGVTLSVLSVAPVLAADLPARTYTKAPEIAPIYNWSGFYIGLNAGGASSHNCWSMTNVEGTPVVPSLSEGCHNGTSAVAGGQLGYRWQSANWVFGLEVQGEFTNLKGANTSQAAALAVVPFIVNQTKINGIGLFTGQVGYAWNNVLWYAKGGGALTNDTYTGLAAGTPFDLASETRLGGALGTGVEVGFAPGWSVAVEYDHLFMGSRNLNFTPFFGAGVSRTDSIKQDVDMATIKVNYTFGGPVVARY